MKRTLKAGALSLLFAAVVFGSEYLFLVNEKGQVYQNKVELKIIEQGYYLKSYLTKEDQKDSITEAKLNKDYETIEWRFKSQKGDIDVVAVRQDNKILLTGTFGGKENNKKELGIDSRPWHQIFQLGMMKFAITEKGPDSVEFWGLRPDNPETAGVLAARREKIEIIEINGKKIETSKLRIGLAGWLSIFWTGDYWFRKSDGLYIKAAPTGNVTAELIQEIP